MDTRESSVFVKGQISRALILDPTTKRFPLVSSFGRTGYFELPGGRVEEDEDALEAAKREVREEIGLSLKHLRHVGTLAFPIPHDARVVWQAHLFLAIHEETKLTLEPTEISAALYVTLKEALTMPLEHFSRKLLERVKASRRPT